MYRIERSEIALEEPTAGENFGDALLALYEVARTAPASASPPHRVGSMYFHPQRDGAVLDDFHVEDSSHGVVVALIDKQTGDTWFRTIDLSLASFEDTFRGPFPLR